MNHQPEGTLKLPPECVLRKACATDAEAIKSLVSTERVNPTQLTWFQFWVIENNKHLVAIGQLRQHHSVQELGSLVVAHALAPSRLGNISS